jgi:hypothetical protein
VHAYSSLLPGQVSAAEKPLKIEVGLNFHQKIYGEEDPIRAVIQIINTCKGSILISQGAWNKSPFHAIRIIDPAGRLLVPRDLEPHNEFPDAPPLGYTLHGKRIIRPLPCQAVKPGERERMLSEDLREIYRMEIPGRYSAQVQLSVMVFKEEPGCLENADGVHLITSETQYFQIGKPGTRKSELISIQSRNAQEASRRPSASGVSTGPLILAPAAPISSAAWIPGTLTAPVTTAAVSAPDADEDGIPDAVESELLHTDPKKKTLFVRPKKIDRGQFDYWPGFIALFPSSRAGVADIPAFTQAGIEISVVGDPGNPYPPMRSFNYDPSFDPHHPPCDIFEILYMPEAAYCVFGNYNMGHTFFSSANRSWYWDTKGYVPNDQTSAHYQKYRYFTPLLYPLPLKTYFSEGAYPRIEVGAGPAVTSGCGLNQCYDSNHASPLNLNDAETGPPFTQRPDLTVEFNAIVFGGDMRIITIGARGEGYYRGDVLRRTIVHEMGHGLLAASENDHCANPQCILYERVVDWKPHEFGAVGVCTHSPGGSKDIRAKGIVHNRVH